MNRLLISKHKKCVLCFIELSQLTDACPDFTVQHRTHMSEERANDYYIIDDLEYSKNKSVLKQFSLING